MFGLVDDPFFDHVSPEIRKDIGQPISFAGLERHDRRVGVLDDDRFDAVGGDVLGIPVVGIPLEAAISLVSPSGQLEGAIANQPPGLGPTGVFLDPAGTRLQRGGGFERRAMNGAKCSERR